MIKGRNLVLVFPAIDIRGGKCVRLTEGDFSRETVFADDPAEMARRWADEGAQYLHVVDLDGALGGAPANLDTVARILAAVDIPVQLGGGLRDRRGVEAALASGVARVILGSAAVKDPALVAALCADFGERIVVGIDARNGMVSVEGWSASGGVEAAALAQQMAEAGVRRIIYTDISRDGTLGGVNAAATAHLAKESGLKVIASGGVAGLADIRAVQAVEADGVEGVIVGKAIYTGALSLPAALAAARGE